MGAVKQIVARSRHAAGDAAAQVDHQPGGDGEAVVEERRVDAAFEAGACVGGQQQFLAGAGDTLRIEPGTFDDDVGSPGRHARMLSAHDTADVVDRDVVGDHGHARGQATGPAVQRDDFLAFPGRARDQAAGQFRTVVDVQGAAEIDHHVIGDVDQCADRFLPDRGQAAAHPVRRIAVGDARHALREEGGAAGRLRAHVRAGAGAVDRIDRERLQCADARGGEVAGDAAHAHAILPVGGDRYVDHRIGQPGIIGIAGADGRVGGQFDDAVMPLADLELARGAHHAVRFDAADRRDLQRDVGPRNIGAGAAEHADQPGARIGRTAYDLCGSVAGVDRQHLQLVRLRVALGGQDARDGERRQCLARIGDALHLQPDTGQRDHDLIEGRIGVEMLGEPGQGELHAPTPPDSVGTSRLAKP